MKVRFWGVRGSCPTPITSRVLQRKIASIIQRITPEDLESPESREAFLGDLPRELFGTVGGNTTSVQVSLEGGATILIDAGTGIAEYVRQQSELVPPPREYHLLFTHFHWDHIQGFPFFNPIYNPHNTIYIYSPDPQAREHLRMNMSSPYFPVPFDQLPAHFKFVTLTEEEMPLKIGSARIHWIKRNHPQPCYAYRIEEKKKVFIFSTDTELKQRDFELSPENVQFFRNADMIVMDGQYTLSEALEKHDWGHTSFSLAIDFASEFAIRNLYLFHHEPLYDDNQVASILRSARWYADHQEGMIPRIEIAREGDEITL